MRTPPHTQLLEKVLSVILWLDTMISNHYYTMFSPFHQKHPEVKIIWFMLKFISINRAAYTYIFYCSEELAGGIFYIVGYGIIDEKA